MRSARISAFADKIPPRTGPIRPVPAGRQIRHRNAIAAATDCKADWSASPQNRQHRRGQSPIAGARAYDYGERHRSGRRARSATGSSVSIPIY